LQNGAEAIMQRAVLALVARGCSSFGGAGGMRRALASAVDGVPMRLEMELVMADKTVIVPERHHEAPDCRVWD
jgi:hypothetical protein